MKCSVYMVFCFISLSSFPPLVLSAPVETGKKSVPTRLMVGEKPLWSTHVDCSGQDRSVQELQGKKSVLITFFPRCFTSNCTSQLSSIRDSYQAFKAAGIEVWAVSTDSADGPKGQRAFAKFLKLPFPLIPDPDRKISLAFGAVQAKNQMAMRMSVFIDKNGVVRWIDKQIDPRNHGRDVLARYKAEVLCKDIAKDGPGTDENANTKEQ